MTPSSIRIAIYTQVVPFLRWITISRGPAERFAADRSTQKSSRLLPGVRRFTRRGHHVVKFFIIILVHDRSRTEFYVFCPLSSSSSSSLHRARVRLRTILSCVHAALVVLFASLPAEVSPALLVVERG